MDLRVKEVCKEKGVTLAEVASKIGVAQAGLSKMLGGNPTIGTLEKIADALGVPVTELFEKSDERGYANGMVVRSQERLFNE